MKNLKMNIRICEEQDFLLRKFGGHTPGFEKLYNFFLENYEKTDEFKKEQKRKEALKEMGLNDSEGEKQ